MCLRDLEFLDLSKNEIVGDLVFASESLAKNYQMKLNLICGKASSIRGEIIRLTIPVTGLEAMEEKGMSAESGEL